MRRFLAVFYPAAEYRVTTRITEVSGHHFKTEGRVLVEPGWLSVYGKASQADDELIPVQKNESVQSESIELVALKTKPPARYTEATLLSAMESAGKWVDDDDMREAMAEKGLGTPATRAAIIEGLLAEKYMVREARELIPTAKAFQLMTLLRGLDVSELTQPDLTGTWEHKLSLIEQGKLDRNTFMQEIAQMTQRIVKRAKEFNSDTIPGDYVTLKTPCPHCGKAVKENYRRFACESCGFTISKTPGGRAFEYELLNSLKYPRTMPTIPMRALSLSLILGTAKMTILKSSTSQAGRRLVHALNAPGQFMRMVCAMCANTILAQPKHVTLKRAK
ncbi:MAG: hypothetical protein RIR08_905 [Pseudomonadota bacterium]